MLKSLVLSGLLASGVGAFASTPFDNQPLFSPTIQAVIYDDSTGHITLSVSELNNYTFSNLYNWLDTYYHDNADTMPSIPIFYNDGNFSAEDYYSADLSGFAWAGGSSRYIVLHDENQRFYYTENLTSIDYATPFTYDVIFSITSQVDYDDMENAIELDIQANQPQRSAGFISALFSFVTLLTSGIVTLATGIASGVVGMAKALFLNSTATGLSIFGGLIAMFAGIALAVTLTTKVYQWITSLGN